jgi:hypothetical protein
LWAKGLNAKEIHKEMSLVYAGKCLSRKAIHNWMANVSLMTEKKNENLPSKFSINAFKEFSGSNIKRVYRGFSQSLHENGGILRRI